MKTVFIAGGAGGVGAGIVSAWLSEGATVITVSRSEERLAQLVKNTAELPGVLVTAHGAANDPKLLEELGATHGPFEQVVASIGGDGWQLAPLQQIDAAMFERVIADGITAHWQVACVLRRHLVPGGSYVFINGGAVQEVYPGTGPLSLVAKAQLALAEIFDVEQPEAHPLRTVSLILASPIATPAREKDRKPNWLTPEDCGRACVLLHAQPAPAARISVRTQADIEELANA